jgi:uncharacterized membrane protein
MNRLAPLGAIALVATACESNVTQPAVPGDAGRSTATATATGTQVVGPDLQLWGINDAGTVAGRGSNEAVRWDGSTVHSLGAGLGSIAWAINRDGKVVGQTVGPTAFLWADGVLHSLGAGAAESLNGLASPWIVGASGGVPSVWQEVAGSWIRTSLPLPPGYTGGYGFGVNDHGVIAGMGGAPAGMHALLWTTGAGGWEVRELGVLPGKTTSIANGINNSGQISGWSGNRAFIWEDGEIVELPPLPGGNASFAYKINEKGDVAGGAHGGDGHVYAVVWSNRIPIRLEMPAATNYCMATEPNNRGQATGWCYIGGVSHGMVWQIDASAVQAALDEVQRFTASGDISNAGIVRGATDRLRNAQAAIDSGRAGAADNQLAAFQAFIAAQSGKHVTTSAASTLISLAATARSYLAD